MTLWHQLHVDMKSLLAWQSLSRDIQLIRSWSLVTVGRRRTGRGSWEGREDGVWGGVDAVRPDPILNAACRLQFRTLKPEEQRQALRNLELHYQAFLRDSQDAGGFGPEDRLVAEREYGACSRHYQQLLQSLEQGMAWGARPCGVAGGQAVCRPWLSRPVVFPRRARGVSLSAMHLGAQGHPAAAGGL